MSSEDADQTMAGVAANTPPRQARQPARWPWRLGAGALVCLYATTLLAPRFEAPFVVLFGIDSYGWSFLSGLATALLTGSAVGSFVRVLTRDRPVWWADLLSSLQACAAAVKAMEEDIHLIDRDRTVQAWLTEWLERRQREGLRPATMAMYSRYVRRDITPALGGMQLRDVRRRHVDAFLQRLLKDEHGVVTVRRIHAVISSSFASAYRLDLVQINPAAGVTLPREGTNKLRPWEPEQVLTFLEAASNQRLGPLYELVVRTGLRRGEVAGLRWEDIDLVRRRLVVRQQRVQVDTIVVVNHAKTNQGQDRRVSLDDEALEQLRIWRQRQDADKRAWGSTYRNDGWVFTYEDGRPLEPHYISKVFRRIVAGLDLPPLTFHGLRHEHASLLLSAGVSITAVSKRLGHASVAITSDLYSHLLEDADRRMADAMETVLRAPVPKGAPTVHPSPLGTGEGPDLGE